MPVVAKAIEVISVHPVGLVIVAYASSTVTWANSRSARTAPETGVTLNEVAVLLPVVLDFAPVTLMAAQTWTDAKARTK
jgi:hypothetical protein